MLLCEPRYDNVLSTIRAYAEGKSVAVSRETRELHPNLSCFEYTQHMSDPRLEMSSRVCFVVGIQRESLASSFLWGWSVEREASAPANILAIMGRLCSLGRDQPETFPGTCKKSSIRMHNV